MARDVVRSPSPASARAPAPSVQLTWADATLHLWAVDLASGDPLPLGQLTRAVEHVLGRQLATEAMPARTMLTLPPPLGRRALPTLRLPLDALEDVRLTSTGAASGAAGAARAVPGVAGATLRWFAAVAETARTLVDQRRVRPVLAADGPVHLARWRPVHDAATAEHVRHLADVQPPACGVDGLDGVDGFVAQLVDEIVRTRLTERAWWPPPPLRARGTDYRAAQATFRALSSGSGAVLYRTEDVPALLRLGRVLRAEHDRACGIPVIEPQLRLHLPDAEDGLWRVGLELVDADRPERWCSAADVIDRTPFAADLAGGEAHLDALERLLRAAAARVAGHLAPLAALGAAPSQAVELELREVEWFLAEVPQALDELGVRLLGPEQLVRARAGVRGSATPRPEGGGSGRFTAGALMVWRATVDDTPVDEAQLARAAQAGASLVHVNGRWVRLDAQQVRTTLDRLQRHREHLQEVDVATLLRLAAESAGTRGTEEREVEERRTRASSSPTPGGPLSLDGEDWLADLLAGLPDDRLVEQDEPSGFVGTLRHYQRRGLGWMQFLARLGLGGCLADDMGLGKTATTLAHLATRPGPHLVVCPLSVVHNWSAEAARFTPHLDVVIHHGGQRIRAAGDAGGARRGVGDGDGPARFELGATDLVVTTYGLLARDLEVLGDVQWDTLVLDEAQAVKNHLTRAARAVRELSARQRLALTGTPVENHLGELWSILDAVNPGLLGSASSFNERYAKPIQRSQDPDATAALRTLTQPFVLRRTKADKTLLPELPDKIEQIAWATLTKEQATMYQSVVEQLLADAQGAQGMRRRGLVLAALTRLKQICNHPAHAARDGSRLAGRSGKLTRFDELVDDLLDVGERALVFTQFAEMGMLLQQHLAERGAAPGARPELQVLRGGVPFLHGGVARGARDRMVQRFQDGDGPPLLLVSLKAGGTGLNLTAASQVIHYDRWWNPAVEDQATDRAWRLGQEHTVLVHKLVCEGTLEERIGELIDDKRRLASSVLGTGEQWLTELSTDELRDLVRLGSRP